MPPEPLPMLCPKPLFAGQDLKRLRNQTQCPLDWRLVASPRAFLPHQLLALFEEAQLAQKACQ